MLCSYINIMLVDKDAILGQQLKERNAKSSYDLSVHSKQWEAQNCSIHKPGKTALWKNVYKEKSYLLVQEVIQEER